MAKTVERRPTALVAAAHILTGQRSEDPEKQRKTWQQEAWSFYDESGPLRYGVTWIANMLSKARLQAARLSDGGDEPEPLDDGPAADAVAALAGGIGGQTQLLRSLAVQLTVPGVGYLVGEQGEDDNWRVVSADVIKLKSPSTPITPAVYELQEDAGTWKELPDESLVVKVWRPHERYYWESDSPARAALSSLRELRRISQYIDAVLVSRLSGAGLFIFPTEARFPTAPGETNGQHPFVTEVMNVMMTAVRQPGTAAQIVPIPIEVPGEYADKFKLVTWASELSDKILDMRESALRQASIALDIPAEILTGMGDVNHWGMWQVEESAIKVHAEPLLEVITSALTEGYLRPVLEAQNEDSDNIIVWADTSELAVRPDRSGDAIQLYDRGEVDGDALRRETGFDEGDAPTLEELADWAFKKNIANAQLATLAMEGLGIPVPVTVQTVAPVVSGVANEEPAIQESGAEQQGPPETAPDQRANEPTTVDLDVARLLVLEGHVLRALALANNRRTGGSKTPEFSGAWTHARVTLNDIGLDPMCTIERLENYCRMLLEHGMEYDRRSLAVALRGVCALQEVA